jgi:hypothetical protein
MLTLSAREKAILDSYCDTLEGLAAYLGTGYEIVLHSLQSYEHSVIRIINGFHTGRTEGAPITDLAVAKLRELREQEPVEIDSLTVSAFPTMHDIPGSVGYTVCAGEERFGLCTDLGCVPDEVFDAAIEALVNGDGDRLYEMTKTSEAFLGAHPETFGAGDSPAAVMKTYYADLAGAFRSELTETYGTGFELVPQIQTETLSGSAIFEANRALGIEAEEYATGSGSLSVNGAPVKDVYLVAAKLGGEWRLIVVYLYPVA